MKRLVAVAVVVGAAALPSPAAAAHKSCGGYPEDGVVQIQAVAITCPTARYVADQWAIGENHTYVRDQRARRWTCKVVERATGDDPGNPTRTRIRCAYGSAVIRFQIRS